MKSGELTAESYFRLPKKAAHASTMEGAPTFTQAPDARKSAPPTQNLILSSTVRTKPVLPYYSNIVRPKPDIFG